MVLAAAERAPPVQRPVLLTHGPARGIGSCARSDEDMKKAMLSLRQPLLSRRRARWSPRSGQSGPRVDPLTVPADGGAVAPASRPAGVLERHLLGHGRIEGAPRSAMPGRWNAESGGTPPPSQPLTSLACSMSGPGCRPALAISSALGSAPSSNRLEQVVACPGPAAQRARTSPCCVTRLQPEQQSGNCWSACAGPAAWRRPCPARRTRAGSSGLVHPLQADQRACCDPFAEQPPRSGRLLTGAAAGGVITGEPDEVGRSPARPPTTRLARAASAARAASWWRLRDGPTRRSRHVP